MSRKVINIVIGKDNGKFELSPEKTETGSLFSLLVEAPKLDTSNVMDMSGMFYDCSALTTIPELDTSNVTEMRYMFYDCSALTTIPKLDTSNVMDMSGMFNGCSALTTIPELDIFNVTNMLCMFNGCSALENLNLINWGDCDIDLSQSMRLKPLSIHNIISQAVVTIERKITLHTDAYAAWQASEYYTADLSDAVSKNIIVNQTE